MLRGAWGNSGTILSQLLRGLADAARGQDSLDGPGLAEALTAAAGLARAALARPVEGTILSVADAAAAAATRSAATGAGLEDVVRAAGEAARRASSATPDQLAALRGRVDAGGRGLVVLLEALAGAVSAASAGSPVRTGDPAGRADPQLEPQPEPQPPAADAVTAEPPPGGQGAPQEVMYLLDTSVGPGEAERVAELRDRLDRLGDSVVVVGGNGLWQVHAHVVDVGAALEAGLEAGRPHRVRVTQLAPAPELPAPAVGGATGLAVVAVVDGDGLSALLAAAGAVVVRPGADADLATALSHLAAPHPAAQLAVPNPAAGRLVAVLPGSPEALADLGAAAGSFDVRVLRTRSPVQVIAALAVHDPTRDAERDLLEMSTAAAGCRHGLVEIAEGEGLTSAGWCHAGDVLGHVDGDVAHHRQRPGRRRPPGRAAAPRRRRRARHPGRRGPGRAGPGPRRRRRRPLAAAGRRRDGVRRRAAGSYLVVGVE